MKRINHKSSVVLTVISVIIASLMVFSFGCEKKEPKEKIKIGSILALTGDAAKYGESVRNGIELALQETDGSGDIRGKQIEIIYEDSKADPKSAVSVFQKLVTVDKVNIILGPMSSSEVLAIAPLAEKKKVLVLTPTASKDEK